MNRISINRRLLLGAGGATILAGLVGPAFGQDAAGYPSRPIRVVTPFAAGGGTDFIARLLSDRMSVELGQPAIVENMGGSAGMIGSGEVAHAEPDGHTLLIGTNATHGINAAASPDIPYDTIEDFTPVSMFASTPMLVLVNPNLPVETLDDLIALGKQGDRQLTFSTAGVASVGHMTGELFNDSMGTSFVHVPYPGASPAMLDLIAGVVDITFGTVTSSAQYLESGQLRALAVLGDERAASAPDVPTIVELGYDGPKVVAWYGVFGPAGLDPAIAQRLYEVIHTLLQDQEFNAQLATQGLDAVGSTPEEFRQQVVDEVELWAPLGATIRDTAGG